MTEVVALRPKAYVYLDDDGNEHKKSKGTERCVIKQKLIFQNFKNSLFNNKPVYRSQERFKNYNHDVYTEEVNKIALSNNDDKRLQTFWRDYNMSIWNKCFESMWKWSAYGKKFILWKITMK